MSLNFCKFVSVSVKISLCKLMFSNQICRGYFLHSWSIKQFFFLPVLIPKFSITQSKDLQTGILLSSSGQVWQIHKISHFSVNSRNCSTFHVFVSLQDLSNNVPKSPQLKISTKIPPAEKSVVLPIAFGKN